MKKKNKIILIVSISIILIILLAFGIYYLTARQSFFIAYGDTIYPPQVQSDIWKGITLISISPNFGSLTNSNTKQFCGDDGDVTILNSIDISNSLTLLTSMAGSQRECAGNYMNTTGNFNQGRLTGKCIIDVISTYNGRSYGMCQIFINGVSVYDKSYEIYENQPQKSTHYEDSFDININNSLINFYVESGNSYTNSGKAQLIIDYSQGSLCPIEQTRCSDGTCKTNCNIICPIALTSPPCENATQITDSNGCFQSWDNSKCSKPINIYLIIGIILTIVVLIVIFIIIIIFSKRRKR